MYRFEERTIAASFPRGGFICAQSHRITRLGKEERPVMPQRKERKNKFAYKVIKLTRGLVAVVSPEDYARVSVHSWVTRSSVNGRFTSPLTSIDAEKVSLSRFILGLKKGDKRIADHWNRNVFDNRRCNLRVCDLSGNNQNAEKAQRWRDKESGNRFKGVVCRSEKARSTELRDFIQRKMLPLRMTTLPDVTTGGLLDLISHASMNFHHSPQRKLLIRF